MLARCVPPTQSEQGTVSCPAADQHCVALFCSAAAEANPACSSGSGCVANAMHRCTPGRNIPAAAALLTWRLASLGFAR